MSRVRAAFIFMTMVTAVAVPVVFVGGGVADAVPFTLGPCAGDLTGTTFTLGADCSTTAPILVPALIQTVNGGNHTISATDAGLAQWNGAILTNANPGQTMNIEKLTVSGPAAGFQLCTQSTNVLYGIFFNGAAGGSVSNVTVQHIFQFQNGAFGSCQTGRAIRADDSGTITITTTTVKDYQKSGFEARGSTTMNVSGSTAGPPHNMEGLIAQNAVSIVGATGTISSNTIIGSGDQEAGVGGATDGTGVLLFGAHDVTVTHNTITGTKTNLGVAVAAGSTANVISFNHIERTQPDSPDPTGFGVAVDAPQAKLSPAAVAAPLAGDPPAATLICNTFGGWRTNIVGAVQMSCTALPNGSVCAAYSANVLSVEGGTAPFTWSVASGALPPGLHMAPATGVITGNPTQVGTFKFMVTVADSTVPTLSATQPQSITITPCAVTTTTTTTTPTTAAPVTTVPTTTPSVAPGATLPPTGSDSGSPLYLGLVILGAGSVLVIVAARRRATHT
jgi:hypothetical protein